TLDEVTRQVAVTVSAEEVREALDAAYNRLNRNVKLQGFRKGRAPRQMLETLYRHQVAYQRLANSKEGLPVRINLMVRIPVRAFSTQD
ncbi:trigger factor family protein, partial [Nitrospiraceae bacterium AH_259_D15_M11_P09]|nr:trigger factor family protein [Nitrospiraceae bacterium AH_259_D15_M11_P09]